MTLGPSFDNERKHVVSFMSAKNLDSELLMKIVKQKNAIPLSILTLNNLAMYPSAGLCFFYNIRITAYSQKNLIILKIYKGQLQVR